jgi:cobalt-zinc-cadmium efflux system outer membrane protein
MLLALCGIARAVLAQGVQDTVLARLTTEALATNPSLLRAAAATRAAEARVPAAGALPDPTLTTGVMNLTLPGFEFRESDFTELDVELGQELPWPGTLGARADAAQAEARSKRADASARRREITVRVAELYYSLRYVATAQVVLARQRRLLITGVEVSTARYASTTALQVDPLQARVALARLDAEALDLMARDASLRAALRAVRGATGQDDVAVEPFEPSRIHTTLSSAADSAAGLATPRVDTTETLGAHPRIVAREAALEAAERTARAEALMARPDFILMTRYGARPLGADFFSASVGVRLPVWGKNRRLAEAARADADGAREALTEARAELAAETESIEAEVRRGEERLRLLVERVVPAARETAEASLRSYRAGQLDFATVLTVQDELYRAELDASRAAAEHLTHRVMQTQLLAPEVAP